MVIRNILDQDDAATNAAQSGVDAENFNYMVLNTGEPYGIDQALSLYRRGLIDYDELTKVVYYSRVRNEFLPDLLQLQWDTMSNQ